MAHAMENRPTEDELEHRGIQRTKRGSMSDVLAAAAVELEKNMTIDKVAHSLESRPTEQHLEETGIIKGRRNSNLSNALVGTAVQLEHNMTVDKVAQALQKRSSDLSAAAPALSNVLAAPAKELEVRPLA